MILGKIIRYKETIFYGIVLALLFVVLQLMEFQFVIRSYRIEIYVTLIAVLFTGLGIWLAQKLISPKTIIVEKIKTETFAVNEQEILTRKISKRELEVLQLMADGLSNQEIAEKLFVSLNTIKSHSSKLFEKLDVKRRTQAVETAKKLQLIS